MCRQFVRWATKLFVRLEFAALIMSICFFVVVFLTIYIWFVCGFFPYDVWESYVVDIETYLLCHVNRCLPQRGRFVSDISSTCSEKVGEQLVKGIIHPDIHPPVHPANHRSVCLFAVIIIML